MTTYNFEYFIGIDIAKDTIAIYFSENQKFVEIQNEISEFNKFLNNIDKEKTLIVMEATGGYENTLIDWLFDRGIKIFRTNNAKFKSYKKAKGLNAKTDKIDAKYLSMYGRFCQTENEIQLFIPKDPTPERIRKLTNYLVQLKKTRAAEKNMLQSPGMKGMEEHISATIEVLNQRIKSIEEELKKIK